MLCHMSVYLTRKGYKIHFYMLGEKKDVHSWKEVISLYHPPLTCACSYQLEHLFYLNTLHFKKIVQGRAICWIMQKGGPIFKYVWLINLKPAIPWGNINISIMFGHWISRSMVFSNEDSHPILFFDRPMNMDKTLEAALDMYPQWKLNVSGI